MVNETDDEPMTAWEMIWEAFFYIGVMASFAIACIALGWAYGVMK